MKPLRITSGAIQYGDPREVRRLSCVLFSALQQAVFTHDTTLHWSIRLLHLRGLFHFRLQEIQSNLYHCNLKRIFPTAVDHAFMLGCASELCSPWQTEVYQLDFPIFGKKYVTALHVPMHHVVLMEMDQNLLNESLNQKKAVIKFLCTKVDQQEISENQTAVLINRTGRRLKLFHNILM
jgi:hypothetical protein